MARSSPADYDPPIEDEAPLDAVRTADAGSSAVILQDARFGLPAKTPSVVFAGDVTLQVAGSARGTRIPRSTRFHWS